jgi:hypothetical protein
MYQGSYMYKKFMFAFAALGLVCVSRSVYGMENSDLSELWNRKIVSRTDRAICMVSLPDGKRCQHESFSPEELEAHFRSHDGFKDFSDTRLHAFALRYYYSNMITTDI